jgi:hypothetical protein
MFDPHIYACQSFVSGSGSGSAVQANNNHQTPTSSPQKNKHVNTNTVIPIQMEGLPSRKTSRQEEEAVHDTEHVTNVNHLNAGSGSNSGENSRKTSTISDCTSSEHTPENTIKQEHGETHHVASNIPTEQLNVKQSPVRKLSRFLVSPTIIETANKELIVQEDGTQQLSAAALSSLQHQHQQAVDSQVNEQSVEMNINEESYQKVVEQHPQAPALESELLPQQSTGFKMPETLEQLKIELENITHAHVTTKSKEAVLAAQLLSMQVAEIQDDNNADIVSEAQVEENTYTDPVGSITTGDNTSVYNSRRTSADMNTNPTDMSYASGPTDYDENLVSEATDDINHKPPVQNQQVYQQQPQQNEG